MRTDVTHRFIPQTPARTRIPALLLGVLVLGLAGVATYIGRAGLAGTIHYPDLQTLTPSDITLEFDPATGRRLLRFSTTIANFGDGPLELSAVNNPTTGTSDAYQNLYSHDLAGNWYVAGTSPVGVFEYHPEHNHWHFEDFAQYELRDVAPDGSIGNTVLATSGKVSFCIVDSVQLMTTLEHSAPQTYVSCEQNSTQGISVGWADLYSWHLPGQSLDVTGLPNGQYWLVSTADPINRLSEGSGLRELNNTAAVKINLKRRNVHLVP